MQALLTLDDARRFMTNMMKKIDMVNKIRITPFLLVNPLIVIWATYALIVLLNRDGMAVIMSGFFFGLIVISSALFIIDRLVVRKINIWILTAIEILILLGGLKFIDWYY